MKRLAGISRSFLFLSITVIEVVAVAKSGSSRKQFSQDEETVFSLNLT